MSFWQLGVFIKACCAFYCNFLQHITHFSNQNKIFHFLPNPNLVVLYSLLVNNLRLTYREDDCLDST